MFGPKMHVMEAPLIGMAIGGLIGGGGTLAGFATVAGMAGMALGALGGTLLGKGLSQKSPQPQQQQQQAAAETPALPPAPTIPAIPQTPVSTPDVKASSITPGEAAPMTPEEIAAGQMTNAKPRRGRLSTILTTPQSLLGAGNSLGDTGFEKLGG